MRNYPILHYGFEKPSPEDMAAWGSWFELIADRQVEKNGLAEGREISHAGIRDLPFGKDSITGYTIIRAESLDEAEKIARKCPIVDCTRVYEMRSES